MWHLTRRSGAEARMQDQHSDGRRGAESEMEEQSASSDLAWPVPHGRSSRSGHEGASGHGGQYVKGVLPFQDAPLDRGQSAATSSDAGGMTRVTDVANGRARARAQSCSGTERAEGGRPTGTGRLWLPRPPDARRLPRTPSCPPHAPRGAERVLGLTGRQRRGAGCRVEPASPAGGGRLGDARARHLSPCRARGPRPPPLVARGRHRRALAPQHWPALQAKGQCPGVFPDGTRITSVGVQRAVGVGCLLGRRPRCAMAAAGAGPPRLIAPNAEHLLPCSGGSFSPAKRAIRAPSIPLRAHAVSPCSCQTNHEMALRARCTGCAPPSDKTLADYSLGYAYRSLEP